MVAYICIMNTGAWLCLSRRNKEKVTKTMTYINNLKTENIIVGVEWEFFHPNIDHIRTLRSELGSDITAHCEVKRDLTPNDRPMFEIAFPPMNPFCDFTKSIMQMVSDKLNQLGCKVNKKCGVHIHFCTRPIKEDVNSVVFSDNSWKKFYNGDALAVHDMIDMTRQMPLLAMKDVAKRYLGDQLSINAILAPSRASNRYARTGINLEGINSASDTRELSRVESNKFYSINFGPLSTQAETIEFRQHHATLEVEKTLDWIKFIYNIFRTSINNRIALSSSTSTTETISRPDANDIFRRGTAKNIIYSLISRTGGATTQELINACSGSTAQNIRSRVSEIRNRLGDQSVTTHTSHHYGYGYGASNGLYDLGGYSVPSEWTNTVSAEPTVAYLPPNIIGPDNVFYGLDNDVYNRLTSRFT